MIDKNLLEIVRCPVGKAELIVENEILLCSRCGVKFRIKNEIPVLLIEEAIFPDGITDIKNLVCQKEKNK